MMNKYNIVRTQSLDGETHLIIGELKLNDVSNDRIDLDETKIREIMKKEARKPLHLLREYE
jgi:hypothetical protein